MATTLNMPPVDIAGLRREWEQLKEELATIPPKKVPALERIEGVWENLQTTAKQQGRSVFGMSSLLAVSTVAHVPANVLWLSRAARSAVRRTGRVLGDTVLDHYYTAALAEIGRPASSRTGRANSVPTCAAPPSSSPPRASRSPNAC